MKRYANLLRTPGVAQIIAAQLTARMPSGMISLAYLLHIEQMFNSYGLAGLVLAATSLGQAIAGPVTSRLMGRLGMRGVITVTIVVASASMVAVAYVVAPIGFYIAVGLHWRPGNTAHSTRSAHHLPHDGELQTAHSPVFY